MHKVVGERGVTINLHAERTQDALIDECFYSETNAWIEKTGIHDVNPNKRLPVGETTRRNSYYMRYSSM